MDRSHGCSPLKHFTVAAYDIMVVSFHNTSSSESDEERDKDKEEDGSVETLTASFSQVQVSDSPVRGLSQNVKKELLEQVYLNGGLGIANISKICDEYEDIFGKASTTGHRWKVRNYIHFLKRFPEFYLRDLKQLGVVTEKLGVVSKPVTHSATHSATSSAIDKTK